MLSQLAGRLLHLCGTSFLSFIETCLQTRDSNWAANSSHVLWFETSSNKARLNSGITARLERAWGLAKLNKHAVSESCWPIWQKKWREKLNTSQFQNKIDFIWIGNINVIHQPASASDQRQCFIEAIWVMAVIHPTAVFDNKICWSEWVGVAKPFGKRLDRAWTLNLP